MTPTEEFESLLKDVVNAKRLSASKMTGLTDLAMKNMKHDTQLVSILYRTHKSLPSPASKIWSLYVFDALCRAAKSHATKNNISCDISTQPGNTATFLLKVGGIVEGLFQDMITSESSEAKEKTKKIYDIWVKGNTFPSAVLSQLAEVLKGPAEVTASTTPRTPVVDVGTSKGQPTSALGATAIHTPVVPTLDPQAALLALLTQAAATTTPPTSQFTPSAAGAPQLDAAQLAVLQQLAHTAASVPSVPQSLLPADLVNVQNFPSTSGFNGSSQTPPEPWTVVKNEQRYGGYRSPEHESRTSSHFDDRGNLRGRYRGGAFRGRGRGDRPGRDWDSRDHRYRDSDRDNRSQNSYRGGGGRNRSKSPPRNGDNWSARYSPPRRSRELSPPSSRPRDTSLGSQAEPGKDEFGRDIRTESPKSPPTKSPTPQPPSVDPRKLPTDPLSTHDENPVTLITSNKISSTTSETPVTDSQSELGLEAFNPATFDFTSPASWEALGKLWQVTCGALPSQEQLMQFILSFGMDEHMDTSFQPSTQEVQRPNRAPFRGRGRGGHFRGRGGSTYGNGRMQDAQWDYDPQSTAAIVLGGDDGDSIMQSNSDQESLESAQTANLNPGTGRMQKVGDKWIFVRGTTVTNAS